MKNQLEGISNSIANSITIKLMVILALILVLMIPSFMVQDLISEREQQSSATIDEVSSKWANRQEIRGPVLSIPVEKSTTTKDGIQLSTRLIHILPEQLKINGTVDPEKLHRGIYQVTVYQTKLDLEGNFDLSALSALEENEKPKLDRAFLSIGVSDLKGIKDEIKINWNGQSLMATSGTNVPQLIASGVSVSLPDLQEKLSESSTFKLHINALGSESLHFVPVGKLTEVALNSSWNHPSFGGNVLPENRDVSEAGFTADWKILELNRNYPQVFWENQFSENLTQSAFGVELKSSIDNYQQSMRSAKYAALIISLTFLIFFLVEIMTQHKIHPFQYILVGLAVCMFYVLLISITEHLSFDLAYLISVCVTLSIIGFYSLAIFSARKYSLILTLVMAGLYGFLYIVLQASDYALLIGSLGLTVILALTMYFTRKVNWYAISFDSKEPVPST
ncbi:cell envelope integrity protein CreD [Algoriphagus aquimarinus]|uniref:cell envelope integrity protein CreD n=1 Tax=Algoriphagus aquimarinus TaxID=237018 RepID=UPI0030DCAB7E|tara:strand:- start:19460 stop:20809 length:1350 start_codon:yes stop_codon:yes gene_type:complete